MRRLTLLWGIICMLLTAASAAAIADERIIFNSVPSPLPPNVASEGPEAYAYREIGDAIVFPQGTGGTLTSVTVVMSSWGCASGTWFYPRNLRHQSQGGDLLAADHHEHLCGRQYQPRQAQGRSLARHRGPDL